MGFFIISNCPFNFLMCFKKKSDSKLFNSRVLKKSGYCEYLFLWMNNPFYLFKTPITHSVSYTLQKTKNSTDFLKCQFLCRHAHTHTHTSKYANIQRYTK